MQPDRRLVQHVQRAHQPRPQRSGQLNPLRLAAGQRRSQPVQRQVFQAHRIQKTQPLPHLFQNRPGNLLLHRRQLERAKELLGLRNGQRRRLADVLPIDPHRPRLGAQPLPAAIRALGVAAILAQHHAHVQLVLLALHLRKEAPNAHEAALAAQHRLPRRIGQVAPGHVHGNLQRLRLLAQVGEPRPVLGPVPGVDGALVQAQLLVRNHQVQVEVHRVAEALAARAGPKGIVEAEQPRLRLLARPVAALALVRATEAMPLALRIASSSARNLLEDHLAATRGRQSPPRPQSARGSPRSPQSCPEGRRRAA